MFILGQTSPICPTAVWNATFRTLAGIAGTAAAGATTLNRPFRAVYSPANTLFVTDNYNNRVMKYVGGSASGTAISGTYSYPTDIRVYNDTFLYILDDGNRRVLRWNNGNITVVAGGSSNGAGYNQQGTCHSMFVDSNFNIYVSDYTNHRVMFWTAGNTTIAQLVRDFQFVYRKESFCFLL